MLRNRLLAVLFVAGLFTSIPGQTNAFDPISGYQYGYALGPTYQFRNRLPAPPYFSVYPPVYYGRRYERPYGDSPFASYSTLSANSDYTVRPKQTPVQTTNPYYSAQGAHDPSVCPMCQAKAQQNVDSINTDAVATEQGKMVTIVNPFVISDTSVANK